MHACLLGGALGDSIGLPFEGMGARRIAGLRKGRLAQSLVFGRGMVSDDTEHAVMTLLSMDAADGDVGRFARALAGRLRWWLAGLPAGIGLGTARSILKLWMGVSPQRSGSSSAGNGPLMRAAVIGVRFKGDAELRREFVDASTLVTHRDVRALEAGRLVAECAAMAADRADQTEILAKLACMVESDEMKERFGHLRESLGKGFRR
jgi:ADP-ribosylglycohydrolase